MVSTSQLHWGGWTKTAIIGLPLFLLVYPQSSWSQSAHPSSVAKILGDHSPQALAETNQDQYFLDTLATVETKSLSSDISDWNPDNSHWAKVYGRVRSDLAAAMPTIIAGQDHGADAQRNAYEFELASHLEQSDVDAILNFYQSSNGEKYQDFMLHIDRITALGVAALVKKETIRDPGTSLSADKQKLYFRMLLLSHVAEAIRAKERALPLTQKDTSGDSAFNLIAAMSIDKSPSEIAALANQYGDDLDVFETFSESLPAQNLFTAMGNAATKVQHDKMKDLGPIQETVKEHQQEWKALYNHEINAH